MNLASVITFNNQSTKLLDYNFVITQTTINQKTC